jgi:hypothetical protein
METWTHVNVIVKCIDWTIVCLFSMGWHPLQYIRRLDFPCKSWTMICYKVSINHVKILKPRKATPALFLICSSNSIWTLASCLITSCHSQCFHSLFMSQTGLLCGISLLALVGPHQALLWCYISWILFSLLHTLSRPAQASPDLGKNSMTLPDH